MANNIPFLKPKLEKIFKKLSLDIKVLCLGITMQLEIYSIVFIIIILDKHNAIVLLTNQDDYSLEMKIVIEKIRI